jgi:hypothetical protein
VQGTHVASVQATAFNQRLVSHHEARPPHQEKPLQYELQQPVDVIDINAYIPCTDATVASAHVLK